jgi:5-hydroxyisourate hydrolase
VQIANNFTDKDGRIKDWKDKNDNILEFIKSEAKEAQTYKLSFEVKEYFARQGTKSIYPYIEVVFEIDEREHYHIPILLNPFGYSTYRGS